MCICECTCAILNCNSKKCHEQLPQGDIQVCMCMGISLFLSLNMYMYAYVHFYLMFVSFPEYEYLRTEFELILVITISPNILRFQIHKVLHKFWLHEWADEKIDHIYIISKCLYCSLNFECLLSSSSLHVKILLNLQNPAEIPFYEACSYP